MKRIMRIYVRFVQKILITVFLTLLYFLGISMTKLFLIIVPSKHWRRSAQKDTYWITADGYGADMESAAEQS